MNDKSPWKKIDLPSFRDDMRNLVVVLGAHGTAAGVWLGDTSAPLPLSDYTHYAYTSDLPPVPEGEPRSDIEAILEIAGHDFSDKPFYDPSWINSASVALAADRERVARMAWDAGSKRTLNKAKDGFENAIDPCPGYRDLMYWSTP